MCPPRAILLLKNGEAGQPGEPTLGNTASSHRRKLKRTTPWPLPEQADGCHQTTNTLQSSRGDWDNSVTVCVMGERGGPSCVMDWHAHHQENKAAIDKAKWQSKIWKKPAPDFASEPLRNSFQLDLCSKHTSTPDKRWQNKDILLSSYEFLHFQENLKTSSTPTHQNTKNKLETNSLPWPFYFQ